MSAKGLRVCLFIGSARENRLADRVVAFVTGQLKQRGWDVDTVDPIQTDLPMLRKPAFFYENPADVPPVLTEIKGKIDAADAFLLVTCEYNNCLPPALLNVIDHFPPPAFSKRPSGIICYSPGMYGGIRAAMQARCLLGEINSVSIPNVFGMPRVQKSLAEDGTPQDDHMVSGAEKHLAELEWYAKALKNARTADTA